MRVALVNALALPDFASGATVQVHRIARALGARGHEVRVFAGARRPRARSLERARHVHEGIPYTTVNTEDFLTFEDRRSFDNPGADGELLAWLDEFRPDTVHAHALQGLGAGWLDRAATAAPVVVTMHDWWWLCAGQFLVSHRLEVDAPLLDRDGCECWGGGEYVRERRAWLAERLEHAAMVLTPGEFMRDSLVANGLPAPRVRVDENSLELPPRAPRAPSPGLPHLGFVGGWHELKGLGLLLEAVREVPPPLPFRLTCWDAEGSPESRNLPAGVTLAPAYAPGDTGKVMASLDALAVPSLMRESYSLVCREALHQGTPVICSDAGGPEDVVRHGVNGLVVETAGVEAWRQALVAWATDPELRDRLAAGAAAGAPLVAPAAQAAHLEEVYSEVARPRVRARPVTPPRLVVVAGIEGAPLRYRGHHLVAAHRDLGGEADCYHHRDPAALAAITEGTVVVVYRAPWSTAVSALVARAREVGARTVFSADDLVFAPSLRDRIPAVRQLPPAEAEQWMEGVQRYQQAMLACDAFLGSTPELLRQAEAQGMRAFELPNTLGREAALLAQAAVSDAREDRARRAAHGRCVLAYLSGTTTHDDDWRMVEPAVQAILDRHPGVELLAAGHLEMAPALEAHPRVRRLPFRPWQELFRLQTEADLVLAPLEGGMEFTESKSAVKWLEAAAVRVPVLASPTGPFRAVIADGDTGFLAGAREWEVKLEQLVTDPLLRHRVAVGARGAVYARHGPAAATAAWGQVLAQLANLAPATAKLPQAPAEVPTPYALEPEPHEGYLDGQPRSPETVSGRLGGDTAIEATLRPVYPGLNRVDVFTSTFGVPPAAVAMALLEGDRVVRQGLVEPSRVADDGWTAWSFESIGDSGGREFRLVMQQPGVPPRQGIAAWQALGAGPGAERVCTRLWARTTRDAVSAIAVRRTPESSRRARRPGQLAMLWHKGRHSLTSRGWRETSARTWRYARRWWRGLSRRSGGRGA